MFNFFKKSKKEQNFPFEVKIEKIDLDYSAFYYILYRKSDGSWRKLQEFITGVFYQNAYQGEWNPVLEYYDKAKEIALTLKSMEDVEAFHAKEEEKAKRDSERYAEWKKKNCPVEEEKIL